jgi:hypothetical protein
VTKNADFKNVVRARMAKTGESYTAARAQLLAAPRAPTPDEYPDLAGIANATVESRTSLTWVAWVDALDALGAATLSHTEIATLVRQRWPVIGGWWAQSVTVGYERIRGLREKGELCTGTFAASKSRTFPVPVAILYAAFSDDARASWMGVTTAVRTASRDRSVRLTWPDGTVVTAWFTDKEARSSVAIQHEKLESQDRRQQETVAWGERFDALSAHLAAVART